MGGKNRRSDVRDSEVFDVFLVAINPENPDTPFYLRGTKIRLIFKLT
jgi:hypothetical protein